MRALLCIIHKYISSRLVPPCVGRHGGVTLPRRIAFQRSVSKHAYDAMHPSRTVTSPVVPCEPRYEFREYQFRGSHPCMVTVLDTVCEGTTQIFQFRLEATR